MRARADDLTMSKRDRGTRGVLLSVPQGSCERRDGATCTRGDGGRYVGIDSAVQAEPVLHGTGLGLSSTRVGTRVRLLAGLMIAWFVIYLLVYVPAPGNGSDFQVFYAAATAETRGLDSFHWTALWTIEQDLYNGGSGHGTPFHFAPYGNPPPFALLLRPLTLLPEPVAYRVWVVILIACACTGTALALRGWPGRARLVATGLAAISPAALFNLRLGQTAGFMLLGLGLWLAMAPRRPFLAGAALSVGMVKPHLMLPVAAIAILASQPVTRRQTILGFAAAMLLWAGITAIWDGGLTAFAHWWSSLGNFAGSIRLQPDVASIPGFYYAAVSQSVATALNALCLTLAAGIIAALAWQIRGGDARARSWFLWTSIATYLALTPYVHTGDQLLLLPALLALIGPDAQGLQENIILLVTLVALVAPLAVFRDYHTEGINALPSICVALAFVPAAQRRIRATRLKAAATEAEGIGGG
jgi:hypothetical protein